MTLLKSIVNFWTAEGQEGLQTPPMHIQQDFVLTYKSLTIGTLSVNEGVWRFVYSDAFKNQKVIQPLSDFPEVHKIHELNYLHPFFLQRIPSLAQPKVKAILKKENIDAHNEIDLLKRFGRFTISNPFMLQAI